MSALTECCRARAGMAFDLAAVCHVSVCKECREAAQVDLFDAEAWVHIAGPTLNEALQRRGYSTERAARPGHKHILDEVGNILFTGRAHHVWAWLNHGSEEE